MIVPDFWAQASARHRDRKRQITVRRFGWSDESEADARAMAQQRADEALAQILQGKSLQRREPVRAYNGADGVPIREEVLARHGEQVITRNSYGAHCLNSPDTLFADIDFAPPRSRACNLIALALLVSVAFVASQTIGSNSWPLWIVAAIAFVPLGRAMARAVHRYRGGHETIAVARMRSFIAQHPDWGLRYYRTPAGMRVVATHSTFSPRDDVVAKFFAAIGTDPRYARMCAHQHCFRARLTGKPWRMGIDRHVRPRPGVWPVSDEKRPVRDAWIREYEAKAGGFAACRFEGSLGTTRVHPDVRVTLELHDRLAGAKRKGAPLA